MVSPEHLSNEQYKQITKATTTAILNVMQVGGSQRSVSRDEKVTITISAEKLTDHGLLITADIIERSFVPKQEDGTMFTVRIQDLENGLQMQYLPESLQADVIMYLSEPDELTIIEKFLPRVIATCQGVANATNRQVVLPFGLNTKADLENGFPNHTKLTDLGFMFVDHKIGLYTLGINPIPKADIQ